MADYVSNKELFKELSIYRESYMKAMEAGEARPAPTKVIADAIMRISNNVMKSYNFVGYSYRDEMVSDAIERCLKKFHLFDPAKSENPFAYLSQLAWNAGIERIKTEQRHMSIKAKYIKEKMSSDFVQMEINGDPDVANAFVEFIKDNDIMVDYIEERRVKNKSEIHHLLVHRNKTEYIRKEVEEVVVEPIFDLEEFFQ